MECTNCGAKVPRDAGACPECGIFARVIEPPRERRRTSTFILVLLLIAVAVAASTYFFTTQRSPKRAWTPPPVRVVHDRPGGARMGPGAKISEPEAILRLQRSLNRKPDCVAILSQGYSDGAYHLVAVDRCEGTRIGRWLVDGKTGAVTKNLMRQ